MTRHVYHVSVRDSTRLSHYENKLARLLVDFGFVNTTVDDYEQ